MYDENVRTVLCFPVISSGSSNKLGVYVKRQVWWHSLESDQSNPKSMSKQI